MVEGQEDGNDELSAAWALAVATAVQTSLIRCRTDERTHDAKDSRNSLQALFKNWEANKEMMNGSRNLGTIIAQPGAQSGRAERDAPE